MIEHILGKIISKLPEILLYIFRLEDKYENNPYHKFNKEDILILKHRDFGYGMRPVAVVNNYNTKEGKYDITVYKDNHPTKGFSNWIYENEIDQGVGRIVNEHEIHSKLHIENSLKKVNVNSIDEALALYKSREVEQKKLVQNRKT
ncbi:hypothetical protein JW949_03305 [Candidatus Woesearchaeota archaeon]|nr:hypothetical protein [Candidatus Woesearchaeota archaeon]